MKITLRNSILALAFIGLYLLRPVPAAEDKQLSVFIGQSHVSVQVIDRNDHEYVSLVDLLEKLGSARAELDGDKWKVDFRPSAARSGNAEFQSGKTSAKVRGKRIDLAQPFLFDNGRGFVPVASIQDVLSRLLDQMVQFNPVGRRALVGNIALPFTFEFQQTPVPRVVLKFPQSVTPFVATEPGRLRLTFNREPVQPAGLNSFNFAVGAVSSGSYRETNGAAELSFVGSAPLMANFADDGKTIIVSGVPAPPVAVVAVPSGTPDVAVAPQPGNLSATTPPAPTVTAATPRFLVVLDPTHGGSETGARLSDTLLEKDVTLALARRLRGELQNRGITALLLRDNDSTISDEQRAQMVNLSHAAVFISLHAAAGSGVHVYSARFAPLPAKPFLPWDMAQAAFLDSAQLLSSTVVGELQKRQLTAASYTASLSTLNSTAAPGIAVEVSPPSATVPEIMSPEYLQKVAASVAESIAAQRLKLEAGR